MANLNIDILDKFMCLYDPWHYKVLLGGRIAPRVGQLPQLQSLSSLVFPGLQLQERSILQRGGKCPGLSPDLQRTVWPIPEGPPGIRPSLRILNAGLRRRPGPDDALEIMAGSYATYVTSALGMYRPDQDLVRYCIKN